MMNRRHALTGLATAAGGLMLGTTPTGAAESAKTKIPGAIELKLDKEIKILARSAPVETDDGDLQIVAIGTGTFRLDKEGRLTATLNAAVDQYAETEYWISAAVFDASGTMLGAAAHKERVRYVRIPVMVSMMPEIVLDFGISKAFKNAASVVFAISERDVPKPA